MGFLDHIFSADSALGDLFDTNDDGKVSLDEAIIGNELFLSGDHEQHSPAEIDCDFDEELLDRAEEVGIDPDAFDLDEDLIDAIDEEGGFDSDFD